MAPSDEQRVQSAVPGLPVQFRLVREIVNDHQHLVELFESQLLGGPRDLLLLLYDGPQRPLVPLVEVDLLPFGVDAHLVLYELLDGLPAVVDLYARRKDVDALKHAGTVRRAILFQDRADDRDRLPALRGPQEYARAGHLWHHAISRLLRGEVGIWEQLDWAHSLSRAPCSTRSTCCFMDCSARRVKAVKSVKFVKFVKSFRFCAGASESRLDDLDELDALDARLSLTRRLRSLRTAAGACCTASAAPPTAAGTGRPRGGCRPRRRRSGPPCGACCVRAPRVGCARSSWPFCI